MNLGRILILAAAAAGATWATERVVQSAARDRVPVLMQVEPETTGEPAQAPAPEDNTPAPNPVPEISAEEMEAELARIEAAVAGADGDDLEEFTPSKPLAADLAIALPSDI